MMNRFFIAAILLTLSLSRYANAQSAVILKDSAAIGPEYYVLEELKLNTNDAGAKQIYKRIRSASGVMESTISLSPEQRLRAKKDTLLAIIAEGTIREAGYGFEHYQLLYDREGLLNLSVLIQSYGSPFESRLYYCFDLATGKEVAGMLFINRNGLLKAISEKLGQQQAGLLAKPEDLGKYELITENGSIEGIRFFVEDTGNYVSSGYQTHEIYFEIKEIEPYIAPNYKRRIIGR